MREEMEEGSPVFAAPGSKSSQQFSAVIDGSTGEENQGLSDEQLDLVNRYLPLAYSLTKGYHNKGRTHEELCAGAENGLLDAARRFDPDRGFPFAAYAKPWMKGGITAVFKARKIDKLSIGFGALLYQDPDEDEPLEFNPVDEQNTLPAIDLEESLEDRERQAVEARLAGESLKDTGAKLSGISAERVRQIESKAHEKLRTSKGRVARACIRDLVKRRGYRKPHRNTLWLENSRLEQTKCEGRSLTPEEIAAITPAVGPSTDDRWTAGEEKRFATAGSVSWGQLEETCGPAAEIARARPPEEHLHKFLNHHQLERFRFDMRAKICGRVEIRRPASKAPRCVAREPKPAEAPDTTCVRRDGPNGGAIYYKPGAFDRSKREIVYSKDGRRIVYRGFPLYRPGPRP